MCPVFSHFLVRYSVHQTLAEGLAGTRPGAEFWGCPTHSMGSLLSRVPAWTWTGLQGVLFKKQSAEA